MVAKTASPGPVVPVPTLGSWIEEDLGPVMTEKPTILTTIKLTSIKIWAYNYDYDNYLILLLLHFLCFVIKN